MDAIDFVEKHCRFFDEDDDPGQFSPAESKSSRPQQVQTGTAEVSRQEDTLQDF